MVAHEIVSMIISVLVVSTVMPSVNKTIDKFDNTMNNIGLEKIAIDRNSFYGSTDAVYAEDTNYCYPCYNFMHVINSFAMQGNFMPSEYLYYNGKYITRKSAKTISMRTIVSNIDIDEGAKHPEDVRFVLVKEPIEVEDDDGNKERSYIMCWYLLDNTHFTDTPMGRAYLLKRNPAYGGYNDYENPRYIYSTAYGLHQR